MRDVLSEEIGIPIIVNKSSRLPAFVSNSTLLIVVSYSGNTEETLQVFHEGQKRKVPMVAVTSGVAAGELVVTAGNTKLRNGALARIDNSIETPMETSPVIIDP